MNYDKVSNDNLSLGKNLKKYRKACALSQQQVADAIKVERSSYTCYEIGKSIPTIPTAVRIAKAFGVTLDDLVLDKSDNNGVNQVAEPDSNFYSGETILTATNFQNLTQKERELVVNFRLLKYEDMDYYLTKIIETAQGNLKKQDKDKEQI